MGNCFRGVWVFFSYPSCEKLCFNGPKRSTRQIFDSLKIDWVINFEVPQDLPLSNKAYLGCLSLPNMAYLIKHMSNWLINLMARGLFATAKLLYLYCTLPIPISIHPLYHLMLQFPTGKHINRIHGIWIWNVFLQALWGISSLLPKRLMNCIAKVHGSL